jgi:hypothetical protein
MPRTIAKGYDQGEPTNRAVVIIGLLDCTQHTPRCIRTLECVVNVHWCWWQAVNAP